VRGRSLDKVQSSNKSCWLTEIYFRWSINCDSSEKPTTTGKPVTINFTKHGSLHYVREFFDRKNSIAKVTVLNLVHIPAFHGFWPRTKLPLYWRKPENSSWLIPHSHQLNYSLTKLGLGFSNLSITLCSHFVKTNFKPPCYHILIKLQRSLVMFFVATDKITFMLKKTRK